MADFYTDKERKEIAELEYKNLILEQELKLKNKDETIGYVSQVNDKASGEQSFVITDTYVPPTAPLSERQKVQEISVIYRGSTGPNMGNFFNPFNSEYKDVHKDWIDNDIPMALQILNGGGGPTTGQLASSAETLKNAMAAYPNANVYVYGHSLASMNGQYAVSDLSKNELHRVKGGFFYQGPNIYSTLSPQQQATADALSALDKLFNYVDPKDIVPIGYGNGKKTVGHLIYVDSNKVGFGSQHMWGGYRYDKKGNIMTDADGERQIAKYMVKQQLSTISELKKTMLSSGGGKLSASQEIFLDASEAMAITQGMQQTIQSKLAELKKSYQDAIEGAQKLWADALSDADFHGPNLTYSEQLEALEAGRATNASIVTEPVTIYEADLAVLTAQEDKYATLLSQISSTIVNQVENDETLARQIRGLS